MTRRLGGKLVIATHNAGKLREMRELLAPYGVEAVSAGELGLAEPEETGADFVANALIKARAAAQGSGLPALADDSGLCCEALDGAPGIYSARWAGESKDFAAAMARVEERGWRRFAPRAFRLGSGRGLAGWRGLFGRGQGFRRPDLSDTWRAGFGYDPCFTPDGHTRTFGEMSAEEKHGIPADGSQALSHRARAFQMLAAALLQPE